MTSSNIIRVIVADDHPIFREGLVIILNNQEGITVVGECGDGKEAVALVLREQPDVAILDLQMPMMSGAEATVEILTRLPDARILLLTTFDGNEDIHRAMEAGARGYLLKESRRDEVLHAIREIAKGKRYLSPSAGASFVAASALQQLTTREREILRLISDSKSNKEIAAKLNITEGTVKSHVNGLMQKMKVTSRTAAALIAQREGLMRK